MIMFRKAFNFKVVSILLAVVFLLDTRVYPIEPSDKTHLRASVMGSPQISPGGDGRFQEGVDALGRARSKPSIGLSLRDIFSARRSLQKRNIPNSFISICSVSPEAIEQGLRNAIQHDTLAFFQVTSNQFDYLNMTPEDYISMVDEIARKVGYNRPIYWGGDHIGPYLKNEDRWARVPVDVAMDHAKETISGILLNKGSFLHIDTTVSGYEDGKEEELTPEKVINRAIELIRYAEDVCEKNGFTPPLYEAGSDEPGAEELTTKQGIKECLEGIKAGLIREGLPDAAERIVSFVGNTGTHMELDIVGRDAQGENIYALIQHGLELDLVEALAEVLDPSDTTFAQHYSDDMDDEQAEVIARYGAKINLGPEIDSARIKKTRDLQDLVNEKLVKQGRAGEESRYYEMLEGEMESHPEVWQNYVPRSMRERVKTDGIRFKDLDRGLQEELILLRSRYVTLFFIQIVQPVRATGGEVQRIYILSGKSELIRFENEIIRASITDPEVADIVVVSPNEILVNAKSSGSTSLAVWDKDEKSTLYDITVGTDTTRLEILLKELIPDEDIKVSTKDDTIVLQGEVKKHHAIDYINKVAETCPEKIVNIIRVEVPEQIMLQVKFAEVNRTATKELGFDFFTGAGDDFRFMSVPNNMITEYESLWDKVEGTLTPTESLLQIRAGDFFFDWLFDNLEKKGLLRILAEPNLVTISGEEASFLAGGEYPIPVVDGNTIHIQFKEYGIKLNFTPHVTEADTIRLKVKPEVSILDHSSAAVKLSGFDIPALITRRAETTVELAKGESLIIGGLISHTVTEANRKVPGLANIPILGLLFTSKSFERKETELLVLVTPKIVKPISLPGKEEVFTGEDIQDLFQKQAPPYEEEQADKMREYMDPTLIEKAKSLDEIEEEIERKKQIEQENAQKMLKESKKDEQPKLNSVKVIDDSIVEADKEVTKGVSLEKEKALLKKEKLLQIKERILSREGAQVAQDLTVSNLYLQDNLKRQQYLEEAQKELKAQKDLIASKEKELLEKEKGLEGNSIETQAHLEQAQKELNAQKDLIASKEKELQKELNAQKDLIASKEKELLEKEKSLLDEGKIVSEKEEITELLMEINRRLLKERNKLLTENGR